MQLYLMDEPRPGSDQVAQGVSGVVTPLAIVVRVHLEDVLRAIGIVLEAGEALGQPGATGENEEFGRDSFVRVAQAVQYFRPAIDSVHVSRAESKALLAVLEGDGRAVALFAEDIHSGDEARENAGPAVDVAAREGGGQVVL